MMITDDMWVTVRYRLFDSTDEELETGEREVTYLHGGYGAIFEQLEQALSGKSVGDSLSAYLQPEDAFGDYDPELVRLVPRAHFPASLEEGMTFEGVPGEAPDGLLYIATDIADESVVLDANHPLAGMSVRFEIKVTEVRPASPEEIADEMERSRDGRVLRANEGEGFGEGGRDDEEGDDEEGWGYGSDGGADGDDDHGNGPPRVIH